MFLVLVVLIIKLFANFEKISTLVSATDIYYSTTVIYYIVI